MKRWHAESSRTYREWRKHYLSHVFHNINFGRVLGRDPFQVDCKCDQQRGRFRKKDAWDCGNTRCGLCHSEKFPKRQATFQEWVSELKFKEGVEELGVPLIGIRPSL